MRGTEGFTLIELLISMVLLMVFMAFLVQALITGYQGTNKSVATQKTEALMSTTLSRLSTDLRSARAEDRDFDKIREPYILKQYLINNVVPAGTTAATMRDIDMAAANDFRFHADVHPNAGYECIRYYTAANADGRWALYRNVGFANNCTGTDIVQTVIQPQTTSLAGIFSYLLVDAAPGCPPNSWVTNVGSLAGRHRIFAVRVNLATEVSRFDATAYGQGGNVVSFRTRQNSDYRLGLGCEEF